MPRKPTLLGVFAHPDDESFGPGGTLARYAHEGADVHVIIATDGIAGSVDDPKHLQDHDSLAQVRSAELSNAAVALGVTSVWSLPYRDSGMRNTPDNNHPEALIQQPPNRLANGLLEYIAQLRPHVIVTHDPFGGYGHPDHVRVCESTTAAFHATRGCWDTDGPQKLYYTAFDKRLMKLALGIMTLLGRDPTAFGRNRDINLREISRWPAPIHAAIDISAYVPRKLAASRAHASQYSGGPAFIRVLPQFLRRRLLATESYTRAWPAPTGVIERDLFADVILK